MSFNIVARGQTFNNDSQTWRIDEMRFELNARTSRAALLKALQLVESKYPGHKEYEAKVDGPVPKNSPISVARSGEGP